MSDHGELDPPPVDETEGIVQEGAAAVELLAEPSEITPDQQVVVRVANRGETGLGYGRPVTVERWEEGEWTETGESRNAAWTMEMLHVEAGELGVEQTWPFQPDRQAEPGWYRFTKHVNAETSGGEMVRMAVRARAKVGD